ncbi:MAG: catalase family protein [Steroidobacteraceae bacterium]|nr:catalase family protein [Deltaproteobacteria bacterium]
MQAFNGKSVDITRFEKVPAGEERRIKNMVVVLQKKMSKDYPAGQTKRDAHPNTLACLRAEFIVEPNIPAELKAGIFALPQTYPAWIRISSASEKIQSDKTKDLRGFAIKIMGVKGERFLAQNEEKETQDFLLLSNPTMPLGTVELFHDAVYYSTEWSPLAFATRMVLSGNFHVINELRKAQQNQTSPLDIRYWSTTPYLYGPDRCVKYAVVPTSQFKSHLPQVLTDHYLTENMEKHLAAHEASFDFMVQVQKDPGRMPVEDAGVEWSEKESPFIKVATIRIPSQAFRTAEREELAEDLSFSPAHSLIEHRPIGGINRARIEIYRHLSEFRHKQNNKQLMEPQISNREMDRMPLRGDNL